MGKQFRWSKFSNYIIKDGVLLIHNALRNSAIKVFSEKNLNLIKEIINGLPFIPDLNDEFQLLLRELGIIVDEDSNEIALLNQQFFVFEHNAPLAITLIVTRRCNFRCAYCYEDYKNEDMSESVFTALRKYIIRQISERRYKRVQLSFFGGEPTLMADKINLFLDSLLNENKQLDFPAEITALMTTNGYLLDRNMLDTFIDNHIYRYQITVDGMREEHDKSRYLENKKGTWDKVLSNLNSFKHIDNPNVSVLLRTNITPPIYANIDTWLDYIKNNFAERKYQVHLEIAKDFGHMNDSAFQLIQDDITVMKDVIDRCKKRNISLHLIGFQTTPFSMICYAGRHSSFVVDTDGRVKKCTATALDEHFNEIGKIKENGFMQLDAMKTARWTSYQLNEKCLSCAILPLCYQRKCPYAHDYLPQCNLSLECYYKGLEYKYF